MAVDPHVYDRLVDLWGQHLMATLGENPLAGDRPAGPSAEISQHLLRSFEILDRLGRQEHPASAPAPVPASERAEIRITPRGDISSASALADEVLGAAPGDALLDLAMSTETAMRLRQELSGKQTGYPGEVYVFFSKGDKHPYPMVRELADSGGTGNGMGTGHQTGSNTGNNTGGFVLAGLHKRWTEAHDQILRQMFGLTQAETRVARELLTGANLREIAEATGRSVDTLRTQLKAIRRKT